MIGATMLALFFVPPMFVIMVRMKLRRERKAEARRARLAQHTA
jgi:hypothetical protein